MSSILFYRPCSGNITIAEIILSIQSSITSYFNAKFYPLPVEIQTQTVLIKENYFTINFLTSMFCGSYHCIVRKVLHYRSILIPKNFVFLWNIMFKPFGTICLYILYISFWLHLMQTSCVPSIDQEEKRILYGTLWNSLFFVRCLQVNLININLLDPFLQARLCQI